MNMGANEAARLLDRISELDFALYETQLYLDGHPGVTAALKYYRDVATERDKLVEEYEEKVAPLTPSVREGETVFRWSRSPWPWELGFPSGGQSIPMQMQGEEK